MSFWDQLKRRNVFRVAAAYGVSCWVMVELADVMFDRFGFPVQVLQALLAVMALALIPLLWFAWSYELTPEGFKRDSAESRAEAISGRAVHRLDQVTIVMILVALTVIAAKRFLIDTAPTDPPTIVEATETPAPAASTAPEPTEPEWQPTSQDSIAVIPFANLSADPENEYFTDGISEEILNLLARAPGLRVASRTSSFSFKGGTATVPEIARELDVAHVLEGSVRRQADRVRISAQLVQAENGFHLWSDTYDREMTDIFTLQEDIANEIAGALELTITGQPIRVQQPTQDMVAYDLFLRGRTLWQQRAIDAAIDTLTQAVERDAGFAPAWAALAGAYAVAPGYVARFSRGDESVQLAEEAARKAVEIDPRNADALAVLGSLADNPSDAERLFQAAIESDPRDSTAWLWHGHHRANYGHLAVALASFEEATRIDPLLGINHAYLGATLLLTGDRTRGETHLARATELGWPALPWLRVGLARGVADRAIEPEDLSQLMGLPAYRDLSDLERMMLAAATGPEVREAAAQAIDGKRDEQPDRSYWYHYWLIGDTDRALAELHRNRSQAIDAPMTFWIFAPDSRVAREAPAFHEWLTASGAMDFYAEAGWPDGCRNGGDHLDCGGDD
ncbi:MAG: hypothetical protein AAGE01_26155 [Pseudomonadota bacterium]